MNLFSSSFFFKNLVSHSQLSYLPKLQIIWNLAYLFYGTGMNFFNKDSVGDISQISMLSSRPWDYFSFGDTAQC